MSLLRTQRRAAIRNLRIFGACHFPGVPEGGKPRRARLILAAQMRSTRKANKGPAGPVWQTPVKNVDRTRYATRVQNWLAQIA